MSYKDQQLAAKQALKEKKLLFVGQTFDMGIKAYKRTNRAVRGKLIREMKNEVWEHYR